MQKVNCPYVGDDWLQWVSKPVEMLDEFSLKLLVAVEEP